MRQSRLNKIEEAKAQKRLLVAILGSIVLLLFLGFFGLKILVGFSLFIDRMHGSAPVEQNQEQLLLAPVLDPLPEATPSSTITVTGSATPNATLTLFVNDQEYTQTTVTDEGTFKIEDIDVSADSLSIYAILSDENGNTSIPSNTIHTQIDKKGPILEVTKPENHASVNDGTHRVLVEGQTDDDARVTINNRIVVVRSDGTFSYNMSIADGENTLTIIARDAAGNETKEERIVTYIP